LVLNEAGGGRVAYLAADIDRTFGRSRLPDHAQLLANLVRWSAQDRIPIEVEGAGFLDCHLYRQGDRMVLHLVNLSGHETGIAPAYEFYAVGPITVRIAMATTASQARLLVAGTCADITTHDGMAQVAVPSIMDHEVIVIEAR